MFRKMMMLSLAITVFMVVPALADQDCSSGNFVGTYLRVDPATDVFGDGTEIHQYVYQLTLNSDGTATQYWTGLPDYMINAGTGSPSIGSWKCKDNGKLLVTLLGATYFPSTPSGNAPNPDISLSGHSRYMYLFTVTNNNTLTRTKARVRSYGPNVDPSDPAGGTLGTLFTNSIVYKRLEVTGADLNAP